MTRVYNFSAGPAILPEPVLEQAAAEMLDWHGSGMSVMEMSHRGKEFIDIHARAEADLRELMALPAHYKVLFLQGGAAGQFALVPMNLLRGRQAADYVCTGEWSKKAIAEAKKQGRDILILDMRGLVSYTDYLVVCTGQTPRQTKAIAEEIRTRMKRDHGIIPRRVEGEREGDWILVDLLDTVVHIFTPEARDFYRLDRLWREAPRQEFAAAS